MKKRIKDIVIGILIGSILTMTTPVLANSIIQSIDVVLNSVEVKVDGEKLDANTILYNGSTYLPMRKVAEAVGKDVEWNQETLTANIIEKVIVNDNIGTEEVIKNDINKEIINDNKEVGEDMDELIVSIEDNGDVNFAKKNDELYYSIKYVMVLMNKFDFYGVRLEDLANKKITFFNKNGENIIENVSCEKAENYYFISKSYYENTILPLINN